MKKNFWRDQEKEKLRVDNLLKNNHIEIDTSREEISAYQPMS